MISGCAGALLPVPSLSLWAVAVVDLKTSHLKPPPASDFKSGVPSQVFEILASSF